MHERVRIRSATMRRGVIRVIATAMTLGAVGLTILNVVGSGPTAQTVRENLEARHGPRTVVRWGWPCAYYCRYPQGYVSPEEWLPWDVAPVTENYYPLGAVANLSLIALTASAAAAAVWRTLHWKPRANTRPDLRCPACGYDLRATPDRCPECGALPQQHQ